ncbi:MAG: beta-ketoacyl synthase chain length factor [Niabella sp.]
MYILSASAISPQASFEEMLTQPSVYKGNRLQCIEPDYSKHIDAKLIRRMSRIIKMGVTAAMNCLQDSKIAQPDAIITATAYGCLADTDAFLTRLVEFKEELLSPTAFIQSTHNTVGAQIALQLKCHNYNNTYVHRGSSFETALLDAQSLLIEEDANDVLVGAADEIIDNSHSIIKRLGQYKENADSSTLLSTRTSGTMAGEGAAFFVMSNMENPKAIAQLLAVKSWYKPDEPVTQLIDDFLKANNTEADEIDLVVLGNNGDVKTDEHYNEIAQAVFNTNRLAGYKNYCGEYPTSSAFALWMVVKMMEHSKHIQPENPLKKVLIYNNYKLQYPTLYLLAAC